MCVIVYSFSRLHLSLIDFVSTIGCQAEHSWITNVFGSNCTFLGSPYINNCQFDAAFDLLNFLYCGTLQPPALLAPLDNLVPLNQALFAPAPLGELSLYDTAFVYYSSTCRASLAGCRIHVAFHGCEQTIPDIGMNFVSHAGLNEVAEANQLIVLYPQAVKSGLLPYNPKGCFDWWGYTGADYASQLGPQMVMVEAMRKHVATTLPSNFNLN